MNVFYDFEAAGSLLEEEVLAQYNSSKQAYYLCSLTKNDGLHQLKIRYHKERNQYLLCTENSGEEPQEVVLHFTGILCKSDLPPIIKIPRNPMRLRQFIQVTSLNTSKYNHALQGVAAIHSIFRKYMRSDKLQDWIPDTFKKWNAIGAGNRYFSTGAIAASAEEIPFNKLVDPDGVLSSIESSKYRHTVDNDVGYYQRMKKDNGKYKYEKTSPSCFSIGDIVEARLSFLAAQVHAKNNNSKDFKLVVILRSLALIDDTFSKKARFNEAQSLFQNLNTSNTLKRKAEFSDEEDEM